MNEFESLPSTPSSTSAFIAPPTMNVECLLCGNAVVAATNRCSQCGLYQQLGPQFPNPFVKRALTTVILTGAGVYLTVLAIVAVLPRSK